MPSQGRKMKRREEESSSSTTNSIITPNKKLKRELEPQKQANREENDNDYIYFDEEEEAKMKRLMGFTAFDSTKGKMVPGNQVGSVHVVRKRHYRQYMNRKGGFNKPLDRVA